MIIRTSCQWLWSQSSMHIHSTNIRKKEENRVKDETQQRNTGSASPHAVSSADSHRGCCTGISLLLYFPCTSLQVWLYSTGGWRICSFKLPNSKEERRGNVRHPYLSQQQHMLVWMNVSRKCKKYVVWILMLPVQKITVKLQKLGDGGDHMLESCLTPSCGCVSRSTAILSIQDPGPQLCCASRQSNGCSSVCYSFITSYCTSHVLPWYVNHLFWNKVAKKISSHLQLDPGTAYFSKRYFVGPEIIWKTGSNSARTVGQQQEIKENSKRLSFYWQHHSFDKNCQYFLHKNSKSDHIKAAGIGQTQEIF